MEIKLRPWITLDLDALCKHADNANIAKYMTDRFPHPYTREAGEGFIKVTTSPENLARFRVIEIDGKFAGGIGIHPESDIFRLNAEIAYWLSEPYWGQGIATQSVKEMVDYAFINFEVEVTRIYGRVFGSNTASVRVLEKAGFTLEGTSNQNIIKNGALEDTLTYAIYKT